MSSQIQTKFIADDAVTAAKLGPGAVDATALGAGSVTNAKVATGIDAVKLADGSVTNTEFQYLGGVTSDIQTQLDGKIDESREGANNGIATLDAGGKVPTSQLPNSVMEYQGNWNANTNSPTLADGTGSTGDVYRVSVAGTQNLGSGSITFAVGDFAIYNGTIWEKSINSNAVVSVNSQTGVVVLDTGDIAEDTNLYFTDERAQDAVGTILTDTATIDFTYNDAGPSITASVIDAAVNHDALLNFVANEHVDHSTVSIATNSNTGLSGGGDITTTRSLTIDATNAPTVTAATGDLILIADVSDSNNLKKVTAQTIADLAGTSLAFEKETFTLGAGDVTNQFITLANTPIKILSFLVDGGAAILEGASFGYSVTGAQVDFETDLATGGNSELVAGNVIQVTYVH